MSSKSKSKPSLEIVRVMFASPIQLPGESTKVASVAVPEKGQRIDRAVDSAGVCLGVMVTRGENVVTVPWSNIRQVTQRLVTEDDGATEPGTSAA